MSIMAIGLPTISLRPTTTAFARSVSCGEGASAGCRAACRARTAGGPARCGRRSADARRPHLERRNGVQHTRRIEAVRQRQLHQNAMHALVRVELLDQQQELFRRRFGGQAVQAAGQAVLLAGFLLVADVDLACRIVATRTAARHGLTPVFWANWATSAAISARISLDSNLPSRRVAGMSQCRLSLREIANFRGAKDDSCERRQYCGP